MTTPFFDYEGRVVSLLETENSDEIMLYVSCVGAIMVQLGRPDQRESFVSQILHDPHLVLDLCIEGRFGHLISADSLPHVFEKMPHLLPLARFARLELNEPYAWNTLMEIAASDPLAAAFALGLHPTNEGAKKWHALVALNPEAIYRRRPCHAPDLSVREPSLLGKHLSLCGPAGRIPHGQKEDQRAADATACCHRSPLAG
jgi:hypothetical protein